MTYVNECLGNQRMGQILDYFRKGITRLATSRHVASLRYYLYTAFTQSHRPKEAIPDCYDKCILIV